MSPSPAEAPEGGEARLPEARGPGRPEIARSGTDDSHAPPPKASALRGAREFINASRTNIALPFSKINLEEPSAELIELAALLFDLIEAMERVTPKKHRDELRDLLDRAEALVARLR